jgi:hypothetical protein
MDLPTIEASIEFTDQPFGSVRLTDICAHRNKKEPGSVYKRLSAHITLDLPDLPELSDALRETASRVESMMAHATARHSAGAELQRSHTMHQ